MGHHGSDEDFEDCEGCMREELRDEQTRMSARCLTCGHDYNTHTCHLDPRSGTSCATKDCRCLRFDTYESDWTRDPRSPNN